MSCESATPNVTLPNQVVIHRLSRRLELRWADGQGISLSHARLRCACKCAWCEGPRRRASEELDVKDPDVQLTMVTPIGDVGLQMHFSDGHDRGIYPWSYLQSLAT